MNRSTTFRFRTRNGPPTKDEVVNSSSPLISTTGLPSRYAICNARVVFPQPVGCRQMNGEPFFYITQTPLGNARYIGGLNKFVLGFWIYYSYKIQ